MRRSTSPSYVFHPHLCTCACETLPSPNLKKLGETLAIFFWGDSTPHLPHPRPILLQSTIHQNKHFSSQQQFSSLHLLSPSYSNTFALMSSKKKRIQPGSHLHHNSIVFYLSLQSNQLYPRCYTKRLHHNIPCSKPHTRVFWKIFLESQLPFLQNLPFSPVKRHITVLLNTVNTVELVVSRDSSSRVSGSIPIASKYFWPPCP